jgi:hypothetical protein
MAAKESQQEVAEYVKWVLIQAAKDLLEIGRLTPAEVIVIRTMVEMLTDRHEAKEVRF